MNEVGETTEFEGSNSSNDCGRLHKNAYDKVPVKRATMPTWTKKVICNGILRDFLRKKNVKK